MPYKTPEELSTEELESFLQQHNLPIPHKDTSHDTYRRLLVQMVKCFLTSQGRDTVFVENQSLLKKVFRWTKSKRGKHRSDSDRAMSVASEPVATHHQNYYHNRTNDITGRSVSGRDDEIDSGPDCMTSPNVDHHSVAVDEVLDNLHNFDLREEAYTRRPNFAPPLPPKDKSYENSGIELPRIPPKKRQRNDATSIESPVEQDVSMRQRESTKLAKADSIVTQSKPYRTKFTTTFDDKSQDIEQYLIALKRWQRLNSIDDAVAISVGLQNFCNTDLANYIDASLPSDAYTSLTCFSREVQKRLGKTANQWMDAFDSAKRKGGESCYTFFARLQSILRNGLNVTDLNSEHKRLIVRKFLKSLHPTLRGHLESRDEPITFVNAAVIAHRVELALNLPKGSTVSELNNISTTSNSNNEFKTGRLDSRFCYICNRSGSHDTARCFGNPKNPNFDLQKFKVINGISKN